jgi:hypothetical protein
MELNVSSFSRGLNQRGIGKGKAELQAEMRNSWDILVGNTKGKGVLKRPRRG